MIIDNRFKENTIVYSDLLSESSKIHNWQRPFNFPLSNINDKTVERLKDIVAIEHSFSGILKERKLFDTLFQTVNTRLIHYFHKLDIPSFIFKSEHKPQVRNRVRSHKGIIEKRILSADIAIQNEIVIKGDYTIIAALINLNSRNLNDLLDLFMDNDTSFILSSKDSHVISDDFLESIVKTMMTHQGSSSVNYLEIVSKLSTKGYLIHRMGGDGGDTEVDFQIFTKKENQALVLSSLS